MPIDDAMQKFLKQMAASRGKPIQEMTPADLRKANAAARQLFGKGPEMARVDEETIRTASGNFDVRVLIPDGPRTRRRDLVSRRRMGGWFH